MQFTFRQASGPNAIFTKDTFANQLGKTVPVNFREAEDNRDVTSMGMARLVRVDITDQGRTAILTLEAERDNDPDSVASRTVDNLLSLTKNRPMSFSLRNEK